MSAMPTRAPSRASATAIARPRPPPPPRTNAVFSFRPKSTSTLSSSPQTQQMPPRGADANPDRDVDDAGDDPDLPPGWNGYVSAAEQDRAGRRPVMRQACA